MSETTREVPFRDVPVEQRSLLSVSTGVSTVTALREASDLEHAVRCVLATSIETGANGSVAYLCEFVLEVADALRRASTPN